MVLNGQDCNNTDSRKGYDYVTRQLQTWIHFPFVFWTLFFSSHPYPFCYFASNFKGTQVVKLIVILIPCHTSLLLDINLSGPVLSSLASHRNTVAAQGHLQNIAIINHHLSLCTDLPCMHCLFGSLWPPSLGERARDRGRTRRGQESCFALELSWRWVARLSLSHEYSLSWKAYCT